MDISHVELKNLGSPSDIIEKVEAGRLTLKGGRRFSIEIIGRDSSVFTQGDWEFVATRLVAILLSKELLQRSNFSGAMINAQGVQDYQTQKFYRHEDEISTVTQWRLLKNHLDRFGVKGEEKLSKEKKKGSKKRPWSHLWDAGQYWSSPLLNITSLNLV